MRLCEQCEPYTPAKGELLASFSKEITAVEAFITETKEPAYTI